MYLLYNLRLLKDYHLYIYMCELNRIVFLSTIRGNLKVLKCTMELYLLMKSNNSYLAARVVRLSMLTVTSYVSRYICETYFSFVSRKLTLTRHYSPYSISYYIIVYRKIFNVARIFYR